MSSAGDVDTARTYLKDVCRNLYSELKDQDAIIYNMNGSDTAIHVLPFVRYDICRSALQFILKLVNWTLHLPVLSITLGNPRMKPGV